MKKKLIYIGPFGFAMATGAVLASISIAYMIPMLPFSVMGMSRNAPSFLSVIPMALAWPLIAGFLGSIMGFIMAIAFNFAAKISGGIEFTFNEERPRVPVYNEPSYSEPENSYQPKIKSL